MEKPNDKFAYGRPKILNEGSDKKGGINPGRVPPRPSTPPPNKNKIEKRS